MTRSSTTYEKTHLTAIFLALIVVALGAYTRLKHAGLGCPDWPKCFQNWIVHPEITAPALTQEASTKAWIEMIHRYAAGLLCLSLIYLKILKQHAKHKQTTINLLLCIATLQALFGMWTVTWRLHPLAVMPHLIGGMSITTLLCVDYIKTHQTQTRKSVPKSTHTYIVLLWAALVIQTILGGWTSANYAALVCPDFPTCQGQWSIDLNGLIQGFTVPFGYQDYEGGVLSGQARIAIHMTHRLGACICTLLIALLTLNISKYQDKIQPAIQRHHWRLVTLFCGQICLGIGNILWNLPLFSALGHNLVALALVIQCSILAFHLSVEKKTVSSQPMTLDEHHAPGPI